MNNNTEKLHCVLKPRRKTDQPQTILVVDDNPQVAKMIVMSLRRLGHAKIEIAHGGKEALEIAGRSLPDLVIVDIDMPKMDGIETARQIVLLHPCSIIFSTGLWDSKTLQRSREVPSSSYLVKPFSPAQLQAAVHLAA
jgi:two-component system OmpR family response regulator